MKLWRGGLWNSQQSVNGVGPWRGSLWRTERDSTALAIKKLLFGDGQQGLLMVPRPVSYGKQTLYQLDDGTTLTDAHGDPVGLGLEWSQGLELGPELVTNGNFDTDLNGWSAGTNWSWVDGRAFHSGDTFSPLEQSALGRGVPKWVTFDGETVFGSWRVEMRDTQGVNTTAILDTISSSGSFSAYIPVGYDSIRFYRVVDTDFYLDNVSVRELPGNHLTQSVSADRPTYGTDGSLHWLEFDGAGDHLHNSSPDDLRFGTESFTVSFAIRPDVVSGSHGLISIRGTGSAGNNPGWGVRQTAADIRIELDDGTANAIVGGSGASNVLNVDQWSVVTVEFDRIGGEARVYANGTLAGTVGISAIGDVTGTKDLTIGAEPTNIYFFDGRMIPGVIVEGLLTSSDRERLENYLANRAGITL